MSKGDQLRLMQLLLEEAGVDPTKIRHVSEGIPFHSHMRRRNEDGVFIDQGAHVEVEQLGKPRGEKDIVHLSHEVILRACQRMIDAG